MTASESINRGMKAPVERRGARSSAMPYSQPWSPWRELRQESRRVIGLLALTAAVLGIAVALVAGLLCLLFYAAMLAWSGHWVSAAFCGLCFVALCRPLLAFTIALTSAFRPTQQR